ncbi:MAG: hypothetical protein V6Z89_13810 [Desulfobacter sp.]
MSKSKYLREGRLPEVLALIQVLAYDKITNRSEQGLAKELQSKPVSAESWVDLAKQHPEFFRVRQGEDEENGGKKDLVSLISRFVLKKISGSNNRPMLAADIVNKLMEIGIEIHDRQVLQRDRWKLYTPIIVAVIAAAVKILMS